MDSEKDHSYGWIFTYNKYMKMWVSFTRDDSSAYWNGEECKSLIRSPKIESLVYIINKIKGDPSKLSDMNRIS